MSAGKDLTLSSFDNPGFDGKPSGRKTSGNSSPMGSNIFIVKRDDEKQTRSHPELYEHETTTRQNIGRIVLRGIRCKYTICSAVILSIKFFRF